MQTEQSGQAMAAIIAALTVQKASANYTGFERMVPLETWLLESTISRAKCTFLSKSGG